MIIGYPYNETHEEHLVITIKIVFVNLSMNSNPAIAPNVDLIKDNILSLMLFSLVSVDKC